MECAIAGLFRARGGLIEWFTASPSWKDLRPDRENSLWRLRHNTGILGIAAACCLIHPVVGAIVLAAGLALGAWMDDD
jgi:hypothetical protein